MTVDAAAIDALLPQTQCGRCGYAGCAPYAAALAAGVAAINRCPPGGGETIARLASLLNTPLLPLDPECGTVMPARVALIDADVCIGCARCLPPCPVDAIIGAQRQLHTVIAEWCTGCELCLASCPVDCIAMVPRPAEAGAEPAPALNRSRFQAHGERAVRLAHERQAELDAQKSQLTPSREGVGP